eukprot:364115-Chlamydomonas_euryale.AAC.11
MAQFTNKRERRGRANNTRSQVQRRISTPLAAPWPPPPPSARAVRGEVSGARQVGWAARFEVGAARLDVPSTQSEKGGCTGAPALAVDPSKNASAAQPPPAVVEYADRFAAAVRRGAGRGGVQPRAKTYSVCAPRGRRPCKLHA